MQDRVNEHLLFISNQRCSERRYVMGQENELMTHSQLEPKYELRGRASAAVKGAATPDSADCLYQLAALTAGIILLATLL
jgi:hypothetical protein